MSETPPKVRRSLLGGLRSSFLTGLVVVLPVGLTLWLTWSVIGWLDGWILPLIPAAYQPEALVHRFLGPEANFPLRGVGVIVFLVFTVLIGWVARGFIGRAFMRQAEALVDRVPVVRSVYGGLKQITETIFGQQEKTFDKTCLVEFPRAGTWAVGLVASKAKGEIAAKLPHPEDMIAVFVGLTPLTSGLLIYVPRRDVVFLDMKPDEAAKLIVSGGLVYPAPRDAGGGQAD